MSVDLDVGVGDLVGGMEKLGRLGQRDHDIGMGRRTAIPPLVVFLSHQTVKFGHPAADLLQLRAHGFELHAIRALERRQLADDVGSERRAGVLPRRSGERIPVDTPRARRR